MNETLIGCIKQTEAENARGLMKSEMEKRITEVLEKYSDINMASESGRKYLAKEIEQEVKWLMDKMFMEEYELILNPEADTPF